MFAAFENFPEQRKCPRNAIFPFSIDSSGAAERIDHEEGSYPSHTGANSMSNLKTELEHIKHHIKYPANKTQVLAACNNMTDDPSIDKEFVTKSLTDNNYKGPEDVVRALLNKV